MKPREVNVIVSKTRQQPKKGTMVSGIVFEKYKGHTAAYIAKVLVGLVV